ncbi:hypothetical protein D3C80_1493100 [compost metagenome]
MAHAHDPLAGLTRDGEGLWQQLIEGLAFGQTLFELCGLGTQLFVREGDHLLFEGIDGLHRLEQAFHLALVLASKKFF